MHVNTENSNKTMSDNFLQLFLSVATYRCDGSAIAAATGNHKRM
jgi:hypothetical protein